MYDVIVVGAGPTRSCAAKILADKGHKVLLVEKMSLKSMDLVEQYFGEVV